MICSLHFHGCNKFSVSAWNNQVCNVFGITKNSTLSNCECRPGYEGNHCEWCQSDRFIWHGIDGKLDKKGNGVECGKFVSSLNES